MRDIWFRLQQGFVKIGDKRIFLEMGRTWYLSHVCCVLSPHNYMLFICCELSCPLQIKLLQFTFTVIMSFPRRFMHFECKFAHPISCSVHISCTNIRWEPIFLILALGFWILEFGILDFHWQISGVGTQCPWRVWEGGVDPREIGPFAKCLQKTFLVGTRCPRDEECCFFG